MSYSYEWPVGMGSFPMPFDYGSLLSYDPLKASSLYGEFEEFVFLYFLERLTSKYFTAGP